MGQSKLRKGRKCWHCRLTIISTAKEIKDHAEKCVMNRKKKAA